MELSSFHLTTERNFNAFCKKLLKNEARDYFRGLAVRRSHEVLFSEMRQDERDSLLSVDKYPSSTKSFAVDGYNVVIENDSLANALSALPEQQRNIVLMSHFFEMTDKEIADALNMVRRTVQYQRKNSLGRIKKCMEGANNGKR